MDTTLITGLITGLGIGSAATALIQHVLKRREAAFQSQRQELEKRYHVIILLMYAAFDFKGNQTSLRIHRPDFKNQQDVLEELKAEWYNMLLFASDNTQTHLHAFIQSPTLTNLKNTAMAMRQDLGRGKLGHPINEIEF